MLVASKVFALALLVVAFSCMCDASHNGGKRGSGLPARPLHAALARTSLKAGAIPIVDHSMVAVVRAEEEHDEDHEGHDEHDEDHEDEDDHDDDAASSATSPRAASWLLGATVAALFAARH